MPVSSKYLLISKLYYRYFRVVSARGKFDIKRFAFNFVNIGLIILDNMHFQYNSMMYGIMILSIAYIQEVSYDDLTLGIIIEKILQKCFTIRHITEFQAYLPIFSTMLWYFLPQKASIQ
jgi:hypothetical protein